MLSGKRIIVGVTGGIAAYKAAFLLRALQNRGAEVRVTMTPAAARFVGADTFASLSRHEVPIHIFPDGESRPEAWTRHISWGEWADAFLIAPCTANTLAKIAGGQADNMLTSTVLAARCPLLICPTMDGAMYRAPSTRRNMEIVESYGYRLLEPEEGYLASGLTGKGRLPETGTILSAVEDMLAAARKEGPLSGKKVVVTAGPTREHIDPVRFISNPSSGKMGFAMAEAARDLGGEVTLLHGPVSLSVPGKLSARRFTTAAELFELVQQEHADADMIIMAAAVSDYTPTEYHEQKIKKDETAAAIAFTRTRDILQWLGEHRTEGQQLIGFAMETEDLLENARRKLERKKVDWIVANSINAPDAGFEADTNTVQLIGPDRRAEFSGSKKTVARQVLNYILNG